MRGKFLMVGLVLTAMLAVTAGAAVQTVPLQAERTALDLVNARTDALHFNVDIAELQGLDVQTKGGDFTRLMIPGFHTSMVDGAPELPQMNRLIEVPFGATPRVEIISSSSRTIKLDEFGITNRLMPHQPSVSKSADVANLPFVYDRAAYDVTKVGSELVGVEVLGNLRSRTLARLEVAPVEYYPGDNSIVVHEDVEFRVVFDGADKAAGDYELARTWSPFFQPMFEGVAGAKANHYDYPDLVKNKVSMVIVTPDQFQYQLADYVDWKTERGFNVIMAVLGTPEVGSTTSSVQSYLHGLYNAATPENPAPSFVLFVGDVAECPTFFESGDATDRPYCAVDGDLYPDMYYGRFSATNAAQLQAQLDKTMMYDQFTMPDPSYLSNVTMIAGVDSGYAPTHGNGQINYGTEHYFNAAHGINSHTYLYPASDGANVPGEVVGYASDGVAFINYTAHGSQTSWSDPSFTQSDINGLTNAGKYFLAVGNCCLTSTYDYGECFGETWLRAENKGAIGYIGGSNSTYWDEDYWWGVGFHASSQIDGSAYPVASTGVGVYDGYFHENGEPEDVHYVTNGAVIFSGNMAVTEAGSSRETYYWNIYNLLGDPSLSTYIGVPGTNPVSHLPLFSNSQDLVINAAPGSYVGLTQGGVIFAAGTVPASGSINLPIDGILTPGTAKLVVTAQNMEPHIADVPVVVPAVITFDPMAIDANVATDVTVTIFGEDGVTPEAGVNVWAEGLDYATTPVTTDANGQAVINVLYPYGPTVDIAGERPGDGYRLFTEPLTVNAAQFATADLSVATNIGLVDAFPLNMDGTMTATVDSWGATHRMFAIYPDGTEMVNTTGTETYQVPEVGTVTGIIAADGYDIYTEDFEVIEVYGQLTGTVSPSGAGAVVRLSDGSAELFSATCDASGNFDFGTDIPVGPYDILVDVFGYLPYSASYFVNYGANTEDIVLTDAPAGVLTGTITDSVTGDPLVASIKVFRNDTGDLYAETASDAMGAFTTTSLPYFTYDILVRASHHVPVRITMDVMEPSVVKDFVLDPTNGDILIIDDTAKSLFAEAKRDEKGNVIGEAYALDGAKSVDQISANLEYFGYGVEVETLSATDPATWEMYDFIITSSGGNTTTLDDAAFRTALLAYVDAGGKLLIEGGEVGYDHYGTGPFAERVLHSTDWNHDSSGNLMVHDAAHHVMSVPNVVSDNNSFNYGGWGDQDSMVPEADATLVGSWSDYPTEGGVICYDPNPNPIGGQIVFFTFNYATLETACASDLLQNAAEWLLAVEVGTATVSGQAMLSGESNHAGIMVTAVPGGVSTVTATDGSYTLDNLYAGEYTILASKEGWGVDAETVTLVDGQNMTGVDLVLTPVSEETFCSQPALAISDNSAVSDVITVDLDANDGTTVSEVEVYIDIAHTYQGDLNVTLTAPDGTVVPLHARTGGTTDDILGWYPADLAPSGDLGLFAGLGTDGDWTLDVSDHANGDTGTLNEWCLKLAYSGVVSTEVVDEALPARYALHNNYPNPFNPSTTVKFELAQPGMTKLAVYDLSGRLVKELKNEHMTATVHTVIWDGSNNRGARVASGTYYLRLQSNDFEAVHKMMLIK